MLQDKTFQSLDKICSFGCQCYKNAEIFMVLISKFEKPIYSRVHSSSIRALIFFTPGFRATVYNFVIKGPVPQLPKFLPINLSLLFCSSWCCSTYTYLRNELQSKHDMTFLQGRGLQKNCWTEETYKPANVGEWEIIVKMMVSVLQSKTLVHSPLITWQ